MRHCGCRALVRPQPRRVSLASLASGASGFGPPRPFWRRTTTAPATATRARTAARPSPGLAPLRRTLLGDDLEAYAPVYVMRISPASAADDGNAGEAGEAGAGRQPLRVQIFVRGKERASFLVPWDLEADRAMRRRALEWQRVGSVSKQNFWLHRLALHDSESTDFEVRVSPHGQVEFLVGGKLRYRCRDPVRKSEQLLACRVTFEASAASFREPGAMRALRRHCHDYGRPLMGGISELHWVNYQSEEAKALQEAAAQASTAQSTMAQVAMGKVAARRRRATFSAGRAQLTDPGAKLRTRTRAPANMPRVMRVMPSLKGLRDAQAMFWHQSLPGGVPTALNLNHCCVGDAGARVLAEALQSSRGVRQLWLCGNHISCGGAVALGRALRQNEQLQSLILSDNWIGNRGCRALAAALRRNDTLTELNFTCNEITFAGAGPRVARLRRGGEGW